MAEPVKIVMIVKGGIVQAVLTAGVPVEAVIIEMDTEGCEPDELRPIPKTNGWEGDALVIPETAQDDLASRALVAWAHEQEDREHG